MSSVMSGWLSIYFIITHARSQQCFPTSNATNSFWLSNTPTLFDNMNIGSFPSNNSIFDITIIGSGLSGSSTAYHLSKYLNKYNSTNITNVLLLDARGPAQGASGRNAGALRVITDVVFASTLNKYGYETAIKYYNFTLNTIETVLNLLNTTLDKVQKGFRIETFFQDSDILNRNKSIQLMQSFGYGINEELIDNSYDINNKINSFKNSSFIGGIYGPFMYNINPVSLVYKLINETIFNSNNSLNFDPQNKMNLNIQYNTLVNSVEKTAKNEYYNININPNQIIQSKKVVFATNAYTTQLLPQFKDLIIAVKLQMLISKPYNFSFWNNNITAISSRIKNSNIINSGSRYYGQYNKYEKRILMNASPINTNWMNDCNDSVIDTHLSNEMQTFLIKYYPLFKQINGIQIDMQWTGVRTVTKDGYPYIGPIVNMANCYICAGFNGLGLSQALNGGNAIASMIVGQTPKPFIDIFLPNKRMGNAVSNNESKIELIIMVGIGCIAFLVLIIIIVIMIKRIRRKRMNTNPLKGNSNVYEMEYGAIRKN